MKFCLLSISGSLLLSSFLSQVQSHKNCKVVYLHVLSSNTSAVLFYERQNFKRHKYLPLYYAVKGEKMDGYSYVYYVNDGCPPWTVLYLFFVASTDRVSKELLITCVVEDDTDKSLNQKHLRLSST